MDTQFSNNVSSHQRCCFSPPNICSVNCGCITSNNSIFDMNDHTTLISNCALKKKNKNICHCSLLNDDGSKSNAYETQPWITFIHILCTVRKYFDLIILITIML